MIRRNIALAAVAWLTACTPGGAGLTGSGGGTIPVTGKTVTVNVSLVLYPLVQTPAGQALGYSPEVTDVNVGDGIVFVNQDNFPNTATLIPNATRYPAAKPWGISVTTQSQNRLLSKPWSSGALTAAGSRSQTIVVDQAGTYLYGCFYHYTGAMRGEIVAQ